MTRLFTIVSGTARAAENGAVTSECSARERPPRGACSRARTSKVAHGVDEPERLTLDRVRSAARSHLVVGPAVCVCVATRRDATPPVSVRGSTDAPASTGVAPRMIAGADHQLATCGRPGGGAGSGHPGARDAHFARKRSSFRIATEFRISSAAKGRTARVGASQGGQRARTRARAVHCRCAAAAPAWNSCQSPIRGTYR